MSSQSNGSGGLTRRVVPRLTLVVPLALLFPSNLGAQPPLAIQHPAIGCLPNNQFAQVSAVILPDEEIRTVKLYFRAEQYQDFYYVEMVPEGEVFQAYFPIPNPETRRVIYYVEAVDRSFNSTRTEEHDPEVTTASDCRRRDPAAAWFLGDSPNLIVGALHSGAAALPPGFQAAGITGFITAAGVAGETGGGIGLATGILVGAGAAATAGVLVTTREEESQATTTISTGPGSSSITTTTQAPGSTTTVGPSSTTTVVGPGTTTTSLLGPTTSTISGGPSSTTSSTPSGSTTSTGVSTTTTTTTTTISLSACFTATDDDGDAGCRVAFNASCSTGEIVEYKWKFQDSPPFTQTTSSPTTTYDWSSDPACGTPFSRLVTLTVKAADGSTATSDQPPINPTSPSLTGNLRRMEDGVSSSFTSFLQVPAKTRRVEAQVVLNGSQVDAIDTSSPHRHHLRVNPGRNTIEGYLVSPSEQPVLWQFDFTAADHFVSGSIRVESGLVVRQSGHSVALRLSGAAGERIRLSFVLEP